MKESKAIILTDEQIKISYFSPVAGFPRGKTIHKLEEYNGEDKIGISCTQIEALEWSTTGKLLTKKEQKRILNEWIDFLRTNTKALKALHFRTHTPQALFDAACCQENLEELFFTWGNYKDLSGLEKLPFLKFLRIGSGAGVQDISPLCRMKSLVVLHVENFKRVEDYSSFADLKNLEQLNILSAMYQRVPIKDLEFLRKMPHLLSFSAGDVTLKKKYSKEELTNLFNDLANLRNMFINGKVYEKG